MVGKTVAVPRVVIITIGSILVGLVLSMSGFMVKTHLTSQKELDNKQDSAIEQGQKVAVETMKQMMTQDKAIGIVQERQKGHEQNPVAHGE